MNKTLRTNLTRLFVAILFIAGLCDISQAQKQNVKPYNSLWREIRTGNDRNTAPEGAEPYHYRHVNKDGSTETQPFMGSGTVLDPYQIWDADDLYTLAKLVNTEHLDNNPYNSTDVYYQLMQDIDFSEPVTGVFIRGEKVHDFQNTNNPLPSSLPSGLLTSRTFEATATIVSRLLLAKDTTIDGETYYYPVDVLCGDHRDPKEILVRDGENNDYSDPDYVEDDAKYYHHKCKHQFNYSIYDNGKTNTLQKGAGWYPIGELAALYTRLKTAVVQTGWYFNVCYQHSRPFISNFDGAGHTIRNLSSLTPSNSDGFFGFVNANFLGNSDENMAYISNLNLDNCSFAGNTSATSSIALARGYSNIAAGGIAGTVGRVTITNCCVTNSTIVADYAGGLVGYFLDEKGPMNDSTAGGQPGQQGGGESQAKMLYSCSIGNIITGRNAAGGLIGKTADGITSNVVGNTIGSNSTRSGFAGWNINGGVGVVLGQHGNDDGGALGTSTNNVLDMFREGTTVFDFILGLTTVPLNVPDFCYINEGRALKTNIPTDMAKLQHLAMQLAGEEEITMNLVLPDIENMMDDLYEGQDVGQLASYLYMYKVEYGNDEPSDAEIRANKYAVAPTGDTIHYYSGAELWQKNNYRFDGAYDTLGNPVYQPMVTDAGPTIPYEGEDRYYSVTSYDKTNNAVRTDYYKYYYVKSGSNISDVQFTKLQLNDGSDMNTAEKYDYLYEGYAVYPDNLKTQSVNDLDKEQFFEEIGLDRMDRYYKLTAEGTKENPIIINASLGGGIYDKGNQLKLPEEPEIPEGSKQANEVKYKYIKLKKTLDLQKWNLIGITHTHNVENAWNGAPIFDRMNYLSCTEEYNDMAAVDWDYTTNDWKQDYMQYTDTIIAGQGFLGWPMNTTHPLAQYGDWDYTTTTENNPILYEYGYYDTYGEPGHRDRVDQWVHTLNNTGDIDMDDDNGSLWFSFCNPFIGDMSSRRILQCFGDLPIIIYDSVGYVGDSSYVISHEASPYVQGDKFYIYQGGKWQMYSGLRHISPGQGFMIALNPYYNNDGVEHRSWPINEENGHAHLDEVCLWGADYTPVNRGIIGGGDKAAGHKAGGTQAPGIIDYDQFEFYCSDLRLGGINSVTSKRNPEAKNTLDSYDAYALLNSEAYNSTYTAEPFFIMNNGKFWHDEFKSLPHEVGLGINAADDGVVVFRLVDAMKDIDVYLLDAETREVLAKLTPSDTTINDTLYPYFEPTAIEYEDSYFDVSLGDVFLKVEKGLNLGKYILHYGPKGEGVDLKPIVQEAEAPIEIRSHNRDLTIYGKDLKQMQIFNALGQEIMHTQLSGQMYQTHLSNLERGAYVLRVQNDKNQIKTQKIIIAR